MENGTSGGQIAIEAHRSNGRFAVPGHETNRAKRSALPMLAGNYLAFCYQMQKMARNIGAYVPRPADRTVLKRIDEFNYAVHTKYWVRVQAGRS